MILMLNGSPRKNGVTSSILKIVADEARSAGVEVEDEGVCPYVSELRYTSVLRYFRPESTISVTTLAPGPSSKAWDPASGVPCFSLTFLR